MGNKYKPPGARYKKLCVGVLVEFPVGKVTDT